jgi:hypothetical protein
MEFDGQIACHGAICQSNMVKLFEKPSTFFIKCVRTGIEVVEIIKFDGLFGFEIPTLLNTI